MNIRSIFLLVASLGLASVGFTQPTGTIDPGSSDISFGSETVTVVSPSQILVTMELRSTTDDKETLISSHLDIQGNVLRALDEIGAMYEGQAENEFNVRENTSFVRRRTTYIVSSVVSATLLTDEQLVKIADLIDQSDELFFEEFTLQYHTDDSIEEIQKNVINGLISESQDYQKEQGRTLTPRGISKMDIESEAFGEEVIRDLLEDNRLSQKTSISTDAFELIGVQHRLSAEVVFR